MKENELFSFIQTGPVVLIASGSALVGFRPYTAIGHAEAQALACTLSALERERQACQM